MGPLVYDRATLEAFAYQMLRFMEGDDVVEEAYQMLLDYGFVDENYEWVCEDA